MFNLPYVIFDSAGLSITLADSKTLFVSFCKKTGWYANAAVPRSSSVVNIPRNFNFFIFVLMLLCLVVS